MLSGVQHYIFCPRQWALIHVEQLWEENRWTKEGEILHQKTDQPFLKESRKNIFLSRAMPVSSKMLGCNGVLDTVEFTKSEKGVILPKKKGCWIPYVIEYKRGAKKKDERDIAQLVAEVICLEETLDIRVERSGLFYWQTRRREEIEITEALRRFVQYVFDEMHEVYARKRTPPPEYSKKCQSCSMIDLCIPKSFSQKQNVRRYIFSRMDVD